MVFPENLSIVLSFSTSSIFSWAWFCWILMPIAHFSISPFPVPVAFTSIIYILHTLSEREDPSQGAKMHALIPLKLRPLAARPFGNTPRSVKLRNPKHLHFPPTKIKQTQTLFLLPPAKSCIPGLSDSIDGQSNRPPSATGDANNEYCDEDGIPIEHVKILANFKSRHNYIRVLEASRRADHPLAGSRLLLLDAPGNIHSMSFLVKTLTDTYFDVFATFPAILPKGPLGILGFGAGSAARIILNLYPKDSVELHGWELDPAVIAVGREFFGLGKLEREHRSKLSVYVGDALDASVEGGFAGILVDLFSRGSVVPQLQQAETWEAIRKKLRRGGRVMVNCGGRCVEAEDASRDGRAVMEETVEALRAAFADEVFVLNLGGQEKEDSWLALTGPMPSPEAWKKALPETQLTRYVDMFGPWRPK